MAKDFILAIDQGTTGSTALILSLDEASGYPIIGRANVEFKQHYPQSGWVEHELEDIWRSVVEAITSAIKAASAIEPNFTPQRIAAIGITNQRETLCSFERKGGTAARRAIVWQCRRGAAICEELKASGMEESVRKKTGLVLDPYFTGSKIRWVMENDATTARRVRDGEVLFATIESYLLFRLTGCHSYATEASNASRTLLMDIDQGDYSEDLLEMFKVPSRDCLPVIKDSVGEFGVTKGLGFLPDGIRITGIVGDQQAALAGQACFTSGEAKCTYGTGAFLLMNIGDQILLSSSGLLTSVAWRLNDKLTYCFEGSAFIAGAAIQFLRDQFGFFAKATETESMAAAVRAAPDIYFVPALTGLGAPYWDANARGSFLGLSRGTQREQMVRAALEAINFQVCDLLNAMELDAPGVLKVLRVDGGACENNLLMQMQANFANVPVERPQNLETTALGAAMFAALGIGKFNSLEDLKKLCIKDSSFAPDTDFVRNQREAYLNGWRRAVKATRIFSQAD